MDRNYSRNSIDSVHQRTRLKCALVLSQPQEELREFWPVTRLDWLIPDQAPIEVQTFSAAIQAS